MADQETRLNPRKSFWQQLGRAAREETQPLVSRKLLATLAMGLPSQAFNRVRTELLRAAGVRIGPRSLFQGPLLITGDSRACERLEVGTYTLVSGALHCDLEAPIRIGDRVRIGHDVSLLTIDHQIGGTEMRCGTRNSGPIEIGDGAWLASRVVVLPGIRIGAGAIVGAGSIVTRDVPPNTLVAGAPARKIRDLNGSDNRDSLAPVHSSDEPASGTTLTQRDEPASSRRLRLA